MTAVLVDISVLVFAVSSMLSVGLGHTLVQILGPLRHPRGVVRTLAANFVLVPLLALLILQVLPLERPLAIGLLLLAAAAGAPFLLKLTQAADADLPLSATLLVLLLPVTIVYMPLVVPLILPEARVSAGAIAIPLVLTMLLPLTAGLAIRAQAEHGAMRLLPILGPVSTIALGVLIAAIAISNLPGIVGLLGTGAIAAAVLLFAGALAIGYALGGPRRGAREVLGLGTGQRNIAAATVVATQAIDHPDTVAMIVASSLVGFAVLFSAAAIMRRRKAGEVEVS